MEALDPATGRTRWGTSLAASPTQLVIGLTTVAVADATGVRLVRLIDGSTTDRPGATLTTTGTPGLVIEHRNGRASQLTIQGIDSPAHGHTLPDDTIATALLGDQAVIARPFENTSAVMSLGGPDGSHSITLPGVFVDWLGARGHLVVALVRTADPMRCEVSVLDFKRVRAFTILDGPCSAPAYLVAIDEARVAVASRGGTSIEILDLPTTMQHHLEPASIVSDWAIGADHRLHVATPLGVGYIELALLVPTYVP